MKARHRSLFNHNIYTRHLIHIYHSAIHSDSAFRRKFQPEATHHSTLSNTILITTNIHFILDGYSILTSPSTSDFIVEPLCGILGCSTVLFLYVQLCFPRVKKF